MVIRTTDHASMGPFRTLTKPAFGDGHCAFEVREHVELLFTHLQDAFKRPFPLSAVLCFCVGADSVSMGALALGWILPWE